MLEVLSGGLQVSIWSHTVRRCVEVTGLRQGQRRAGVCRSQAQYSVLYCSEIADWRARAERAPSDTLSVASPDTPLNLYLLYHESSWADDGAALS